MDYKNLLQVAIERRKSCYFTIILINFEQIQYVIILETLARLEHIFTAYIATDFEQIWSFIAQPLKVRQPLYLENFIIALRKSISKSFVDLQEVFG